MKVSRLFLFAAALTLASCQTATDAVDTATDAAGAVADVAGDAMSSNAMTSALASDFPRLSEALVQYAEAMPADKYGFKPTPEVDSFGEALMHAASAVMGVCGTISDAAPPEVNMEATSKEDIIAAIKTVYAHAADVVGGLSDSDLSDEVSLFGGAIETTKAGAIGIASNHSTHHKGGLVVYLRLNGITPPQFGGI